MTQSPKSPWWTERRREAVAFLVLVSPNLILLGIWTYWPFIQSFYLSLTDWNPLKPNSKFVAFDNYRKLLASSDFWQITRNTLIFAAGTVTIGLALALALAVLLNQKLAGRSLWRFIYFSPHITTTAAIALVWSAMYAPDYGVFAALLSAVGVTFPNVLASPAWVLPALMLVAIWKGLGFSMVVFLAALQGVDRALLEAAAIDGANGWQRFWHVTFPAISPVTYFLVVVGVMGAIKTFDLVAVMTGGGPAGASNMYVYQIYREAFDYLRMGMASALAVIMFVLILALTYFQAMLKRRWVSY